MTKKAINENNKQKSKSFKINKLNSKFNLKFDLKFNLKNLKTNLKLNKLKKLKRFQKF